MSVSGQLWFLQQKDSTIKRIAIPSIAACAMLGSSFLPWLRDPLGQVSTAWRLPVDIGWQVRLGVFSYGLLCLTCAAFAAGVACANWREFKGSAYFLHKYRLAGLLCLAPLLLLALQYLCADVRDIDVLAQHKIQALLISDHFGYGAASDLVVIKPFELDVSLLSGRAMLLLDQLGLGATLPLISAWLLIDYKRFITIPKTPLSAATRERKRGWLWFSLSALFAVLLLRAPIGMTCEYEAKVQLASGKYAQALGWLDAARLFNPALEQVAYYHRERGLALYFLHPGQITDESSLYLASTYRAQNDYLNAYSQLLGSWQSGRSAPWVASEMSITLEGLAEYTHPLRGPLVKRPLNDDTALPWAQILVQVDASNTFGHYVIGRITYDLHSYNTSISQMTMVVQQSSNADIQSSAVTYIGLSEIGLGNESQGRGLLFKAVSLDPHSRNNTAREELSGLR